MTGKVASTAPASCAGRDSFLSARSVAAFGSRLFAGALAGLFLSLALSRVVWLEMRVDTGYLIPVCAFGLALFGGRARRWVSLPAVLAAQAVLAGLFLAAGGFDPSSLAVLPAALVRDGLMLHGLSLSAMNAVLLAGLLAGNLSVAVSSRRG